jgi:TonB family protein
MPTAATRRGRRVSPATTWTVVAFAVLVHGAVLGTVEALDLVLLGQGMSTRDHDGELADARALRAGCRGDAWLAGGARMSLCFAPWRADTEACVEAAQLEMFMDLSSCEARDNPAVATIAMIQPRAADRIKPIDPEPLLEMLKQPDQPPPPPPPPPTPQPQEQPPPPPPPPPSQARAPQVVETAKPTLERAPENARFLAEYDTRVDKQTVARGSVKEPMVAKSKPEELAAKQDPREASIKEEVPDRPRGMDRRAPDAPGTLSMRSPGTQAPAEVEQDARARGTRDGATGPPGLDGIMARRGDGAIEKMRRERSEIPRGQNGAGGGAPDVPNLKPSQEVLERALGGGSVDHLEEVAAGEETALNAKRWVHASFFNRLKRQVAQNWDPASVWRRVDPQGQVHGFKTRVTEVRVSLSPKGELAKIVVTSPSGVSQLDDEALRAFGAAAPFPNPPRELANGDGLITFAFSFYFEIGAPRTSWRVIRPM